MSSSKPGFSDIFIKNHSEAPKPQPLPTSIAKTKIVPSYNAVPPPAKLVSRDRRSPFVHSGAYNSVGAREVQLPFPKINFVPGDTVHDILEITPGNFKHQPGSSKADLSAEYRNGFKYVRPIEPSFPPGATPSRNPLFNPGNQSKYVGTDVTSYGVQNREAVNRARSVFEENINENVSRKQQLKPRKLDGNQRLGANSTVGSGRTTVGTNTTRPLTSAPFTTEANLEQQKKSFSLSKAQSVAFGAGNVAATASTAICNYYKTFPKISPIGTGSGDFSPWDTRADQIEANDRKAQLDASKQNQKAERVNGIVQTGISIAELALLFL